MVYVCVYCTWFEKLIKISNNVFVAIIVDIVDRF